MAHMTSQPTNSLASTAGPPPPPVAEPSSPAGRAGAPERRQVGIGRAIGYAVAVLPLAMAGLVELLSPGFLTPLADGRLSIMGYPVGLIVVALVVLLAVIGVLAVRSIRQPLVVALVLVFTTLVGITVIVFAPAFILIAINLRT